MSVDCKEKLGMTLIYSTVIYSPEIYSQEINSPAGSLSRLRRSRLHFN